MSRSKSSLRQPGSGDFGKYLTELRKQHALKPSQVARQVGVSPQNFRHYEKGRTIPPDPLLIKLAQLYHVPPEELLRKAYWPQLIILPLVAIMEPNQLPPDLVQELEKGLEEAERQQLTQYIEELLGGRSTRL